MPEDLMRYDQLAQLALRGVVREALRRVEREGLPGEHHFYIAFNTRFPGVIVSARTMERYPREMTIVLQHQYWNLKVHDTWFEVELSFDNIPEKLIVPFNAVKGFLDPYVQFGLQFEVVPVEEQAAGADAEGRQAGQPPKQPSGPDDHNAAAGADENADPTVEQTKVISLDSFRKK